VSDDRRSISDILDATDRMLAAAKREKGQRRWRDTRGRWFNPRPAPPVAAPRFPPRLAKVIELENRRRS
jgi:hypothetical protein